MPRFANLSLQRKLILILMFTSMTALALAFAGLTMYEFSSFRSQLAREVGTIAGIISENSQAALAFQDAKAARETLAVLGAEPRILAGCIYSAGDRLVATHAPGREKCPVASPARIEPVFESARMTLGRPIVLDGQQVGIVYLISGLDEMYDRLWRYAFIALAVAAASLVAAFIVSSLLQGVISGPILNLAETATLVSIRRNYSIRAGKQASDEIGLLVDRFNAMLDQIQEQDERLRQGQDELESRVAERTAELQNAIAEHKRTQRDLLAAKQSAEEASIAKSAFLANMSHELRTPLNAIIGYAEMLCEDAEAAGQPGCVADLRKIVNAGKHLLALINDILDLSKIEAGKMEIHIDSFRVGDLVEAALHSVEPLARKNNNMLLVDCAEPNLCMNADMTKFRQSLLNLLSNACKFTENGTVTLEVSRSHEDGVDWIHWNVRDTGIGIAPEQLNKLFQSFSQVDSSSTRKYGGTGLGLAISQRLCSMMGGKITVDTTPGRGSNFTIHLPLDGSAPDAAGQEPAPAEATA